MKRFLVLFLTLFLPQFISAEIKYFKSDEVGITLEQIAWYRIEEFEYVVSLEEKDNTIIKRLYKNQKEVNRWESVYDNNARKIKESEYSENILTSILKYNKDGAVSEEYLYTQGELSEKQVYHYTKIGLAKIQAFNGKDELLYEDFFSLSRNGRLRSVIRIWANGNIRISRFAFGSSILVEQREYIESKMFITRFNSKGKVISWEQWQDERLENSKVIVYNSDLSIIQREEETDHLKNQTTVRIYDENGHLLNEEVSLNSSKQSEVQYEYDNKGRLIVKRIKGPLGIEEWRYFYNDADKLLKEEYFLRGFHEKSTYYEGEGSYYEEIFRDDEVFLRVYYKEDKKVKEEFIVDGKVEKIRTFEENQ
jgi:hypothetical protein